MVQVYVGIGSNVGDRRENMDRAAALLKEKISPAHFKTSAIRETSPVGGPPQENFLNAVWSFETDLGAKSLLEVLLGIERALGRERKEKNGPRTMDLDVLFYGEEKIRQPGLTIPHPRLHERKFVLDPLYELAPDFKHPVFHQTIRELRKAICEKD